MVWFRFETDERERNVDGSMMAISMAAGGVVFVAFIVIWFVRGRLRRDSGAADSTTHPPRLEQRSQPRRVVAWPAEVVTAGGAEAAEIRDIGPGGAFVAGRPLPLGERCQIRFRPTGDTLLALEATVVWSNSGMPSDRVIRRGMGVRFLQIDPAARRRLSECLQDAVGPVPRRLSEGGP